MYISLKNECMRVEILIKYISFEINDGELFENTKKLGKKVKNSIKKNFKLKQHTTKNI